MKPQSDADHGQHILSLIQKWRTGTLTDSEHQVLNTWYFALEEKEIGAPVEFTVDLVEKRLHEQLYNNTPAARHDGFGPPNPLKEKNTDKKL